ncbi:Oxygen sensor histidine kinase NreB [Pirellula sp. SH-Sr6A]|nr:Oxygen sensor histidine kinase NreB [Pirellula sp. SH-Sr6A]
MASHLKEQLAFEEFLSQLSSVFVNVKPIEVDSRIKSALQSIAKFLNIDRTGFGEVTSEGLLILQSYELPGLSPMPRVILEQEFPVYMSLIQRGEVFRMPEDLPPEASRELDYCSSTGLLSNLTIPLKSMGRVVGGFSLELYRRRVPWPEELVHRLCLVGEIFSNAIERKRTDIELRSREASLSNAHDELRQLAAKLLHAQEEERRRIAREMHDDWTQRLALLGIDVARLSNESEIPARMREPLLAMQSELVRLAEDVHALSRQLHPSILDDLGLVEALRSECSCFSRRERIAVEYVAIGGDHELPKEISLCIYRVAQEALRNIAKHAAVAEAKVSLQVSPSRLLLRVEDKGIGFDSESMRSQPGLGLSSMIERVRLIGAELTVLTSPGCGTVLKVLITIDGSTR